MLPLPSQSLNTPRSRPRGACLRAAKARSDTIAPVSLPERFARVLVSWGVPPDVRARLAEQYMFLGQPALDAFAAICDAAGREPSELVPADLDDVRTQAGAAYVDANHAKWVAGEPSPGFWRDRRIEGGPTGLVTPLGDLASPSEDLIRRIADAAARAAGPDQPRPQGLLMLSRNSHHGNRPGEFSLDIVPSDIAQAHAVNRGVGQQHTLPGSIGEASGSALSDPAVAVLWEIQPNIYKPSGERNREANAAWRRHRNWHLTTATAAIAWLLHNGYRVHVLTSEALQLAHEVNPDKPVSPEIEAMHDRTVDAALAALGLARGPCDAADEAPLARILDATLSHHRGDRAPSSLVFRAS